MITMKTEWEDLTLKGFVNNIEVALLKMTKNPIISKLLVKVDDVVLNVGVKVDVQ